MPLFAYKAKKDDGSTVEGMLQADTERGALDALGRQGVFPLEIEESGAARKAEVRTAARKSRRRIKVEDVGLFTQQLGDLLKAGVPINRALGTLQAQTSNAAFSELIAELSKEIASGKPLHETLARHPKHFPALYTSMVRAGETGGFLEDVLHRLALFIDKDSDLRSRLKAALAYPALLIVMGTGAIAFLMIFLIPKFSEIFSKLGSELPWNTKVIMSVSYFMRDYWMIPVSLIVLLPFVWARITSTFAGRHTVD